MLQEEDRWVSERWVILGELLGSYNKRDVEATRVLVYNTNELINNPEDQKRKNYCKTKTMEAEDELLFLEDLKKTIIEIVMVSPPE